MKLTIETENWAQLREALIQMHPGGDAEAEVWDGIREIDGRLVALERAREKLPWRMLDELQEHGLRCVHEPLMFSWDGDADGKCPYPIMSYFPTPDNKWRVDGKSVELRILICKKCGALYAEWKELPETSTGD